MSDEQIEALRDARSDIHGAADELRHLGIRDSRSLAEMDAACQHWLAMRGQPDSARVESQIGCGNSFTAAPCPTPVAPSLHTDCSTVYSADSWRHLLRGHDGGIY